MADDYALRFKGTTGHVLIENAPDIVFTGYAHYFTIEFIARTSYGGTIFDSWETENHRGFKIRLNDIGRPHILFQPINMVPVFQCNILGDYLADTWYHYALTLTYRTIRFYVDGVQKQLDIDGGVWQKNIGSGAPLTIVSDNKYIGVNKLIPYPRDYFQGDIKMLGYYTSTALTSGDIANRYATGYFTGSETGLSWASNFNDGEGTSVTDLVENNNATINSLQYVSWLDLTPDVPAELLQQRVVTAIKEKFDETNFTNLNSLYFQDAPQSTEPNYAVFYWVHSDIETDSGLEAIEIQFNLYVGAISDLGTSVDEFQNTFDWCNLNVPGYNAIKMQRQRTLNVGYVDDIWQITIIYELLIS